VGPNDRRIRELPPRYASGHEAIPLSLGLPCGEENCGVHRGELRGSWRAVAKLGKVRTGKVCVYIRRLADIDLKFLETLVARSIAETKRLYPSEKTR
jgi:hypothetical protein